MLAEHEGCFVIKRICTSGSEYVQNISCVMTESGLPCALYLMLRHIPARQNAALDYSPCFLVGNTCTWPLKCLF